MGYREEDFLLLSGIQHFSFCRRQWALIHIEQQWKENLKTVEGNIVHEHCHDEIFSRRGAIFSLLEGFVSFLELWESQVNVMW